MKDAGGLGRKGLSLLACAQGLYLSNNVLLFSVNGLLGLEIAPKPWLSTLPLMAYLGGGAFATSWVAHHHRIWGRRKAFLVGILVAAVSAMFCAWAAMERNFPLLVAATLVGGYANASGSLYRFASTEIVESGLKEKAISWVLAGGILGGVLGPNLAKWTMDLGAWPFVWSYLSLVGLAAASAVLVSRIQFPPAPAVAPAAVKLRFSGRPAGFFIAILIAAMGNGMMNLLMAATPIAMKQCHHPFSATTVVLESHVVAMFLPSFVTGSIIKKTGPLPVLWAGIVIYLVCSLIALSGTDLMHFLGALIALGVGWNFLFVGATTLFTTTYAPEEKNAAQGTMDFFVYLTLVVTSFSSGALVTAGGWTWMNMAAFAPLCVMTAGLLWLGLSERKSGAAEVAA